MKPLTDFRKGLTLAIWIALLGMGCSVPHKERICESFVDEASDSDVTVAVTNDGTSPVFLRTDCEGFVPFGLTDSQGELVEATNAGCSLTCDDRLDGGAGCSDICLLGIVVIPPGGEYHIKWDGLVEQAVTMPGECNDDGVTPISCNQRVAASGDFALEISYWTEAGGCTNGTESVECGCPAGDSSCTISGVPQGEVQTQSVGVGVPATSLTVLLVQP